MSWIFPILGSLMLIFRIWLCEVKLVRELEFRRRYLSRFMGYFFWVAMVLDFQNDIFNLIIITELVGNIIYLVGWDIPFFIKLKDCEYIERHHFWMVIERLTLHPPIIAAGIRMYIVGPKTFVAFDSYGFFAAIVLVFGSWCLWDERFTKKYLNGMKFQITILLISSFSGAFLYFMFI